MTTPQTFYVSLFHNKYCLYFYTEIRGINEFEIQIDQFLWMDSITSEGMVRDSSVVISLVGGGKSRSYDLTPYSKSRQENSGGGVGRINLQVLPA